MEKPKLRDIQLFPVVVEGKRMGCLHDPLRISDKPLLLPWRFVTILPFLDGMHDLLDIQAEYTRIHGDLLFSDDLSEFLRSLDHYLFLDSERFREFRDIVKRQFIESPIRPAFFSGMRGILQRIFRPACTAPRPVRPQDYPGRVPARVYSPHTPSCRTSALHGHAL